MNKTGLLQWLEVMGIAHVLSEGDTSVRFQVLPFVIVARFSNFFPFSKDSWIIIQSCLFFKC